jgi:hypothetical protein
MDMLVDLVRAGLATAKAERVVAGGRAIEVARMKITEARSAGSLTPHAIQLKARYCRERGAHLSITDRARALVTERPVALPPVWLEEGSMSKADEYRQFASDCIVWARIATSGDQREQFLELAKKWMSDAESIDPRMGLAAKASEMAGEEIDRLGDPLATDEERQLRKRRLIKGPKEFRDIRIV